ncbi:hypothetical protein OAF85_00240 [Planctomycetota bacterium]|jgi:hypothetical protein|nr:hypothetical protein [Planctomycetota bacterium]
MKNDSLAEARGESGPNPFGGLSLALKVVWAVLFAAIGVLTLARVLDTSTTVEVSAVGVRNPDGSWAIVTVERICREALLAHGEDPEGAQALDYVPGSRFGENATDPDRLLTAWQVASDGRRVTVYVDIEGAKAHCRVSEAK